VAACTFGQLDGLRVDRGLHGAVCSWWRASRPREGGSMSVPLNAAGGLRSPATMRGYLAGRLPRNKGPRDPPDPPRVVGIVAVMCQAGDVLQGGASASFGRAALGRGTSPSRRRSPSPSTTWSLAPGQRSCATAGGNTLEMGSGFGSTGGQNGYPPSRVRWVISATACRGADQGRRRGADQGRRLRAAGRRGEIDIASSLRLIAAQSSSWTRPGWRSSYARSGGCAGAAVSSPWSARTAR
jgi:hypothetical protein